MILQGRTRELFGCEHHLSFKKRRGRAHGQFRDIRLPLPLQAWGARLVPPHFQEVGPPSLVSSGQNAAAQCLRDGSAFAESCMSSTFQKVRELDPHREQLILPSPPKSKVSSKYHLNQAWARVKVQFIARQNSSSVVKPDKLCASKYNDRTGIRWLFIPISKGRNWEKPKRWHILKISQDKIP